MGYNSRGHCSDKGGDMLCAISDKLCNRPYYCPLLSHITLLCCYITLFLISHCKNVHMSTSGLHILWNVKNFQLTSGRLFHRVGATTEDLHQWIFVNFTHFLNKLIFFKKWVSLSVSDLRERRRATVKQAPYPHISEAVGQHTVVLSTAIPRNSKVACKCLKILSFGLP